MKIYDVKKEDIEAALEGVNLVFNENIVFKRFEEHGTRKKSYTVTLTVKDSSKEGGRRSPWITRKDGQPKRIAAACWHVHGVFMSLLFHAAPLARVRATGELITREAGNWQDRNIGSMFNPCMYSDACECEEDEGLIYKVDKIRFAEA